MGKIRRKSEGISSLRAEHPDNEMKRRRAMFAGTDVESCVDTLNLVAYPEDEGRFCREKGLQEGRKDKLR